MAKNQNRKRWPNYDKKLIGSFSDVDLDTLEKLAKTARKDLKKYQEDFLRIVEFTNNQLDYRPGVYLIKFLVCYGAFGKAFAKTYQVMILDPRWKTFANKFGDYVLHTPDFENTVVTAYKNRHPNN